MSFCETVASLPPEARLILDHILQKFIVPCPAIYGPSDENDHYSHISWSYKTLYLEFTWSEVDGYQWFATDRTTRSKSDILGKDYDGSDATQNFTTPVPEKAEEWIKKFFPQTFGDYIFKNSTLERE